MQARGQAEGVSPDRCCSERRAGTLAYSKLFKPVLKVETISADRLIGATADKCQNGAEATACAVASQHAAGTGYQTG